MLQRLPIGLAQVKAGNTFENLLNEIHQIRYFLYQVKRITKKLFNNIMNSIRSYNRMDTLFINSLNSKIFDYHRLLLNVLNEINKAINMLLYHILAITWKNIKKSYKNNKFKILAPT